MTSTRQMAAGHPGLTAAVQRIHRLLHRRALVAAVASAVPVPGLDLAVDAALLSRLLQQISAEFGTRRSRWADSPPHKHEQVQRAMTLVGSVLIGNSSLRRSCCAPHPAIGQVCAAGGAGGVGHAGLCLAALPV